MGTMLKMNVYKDGDHYMGKLCKPLYMKRPGATGIRDEHKQRMRNAFRTAWNEAKEQRLNDKARKEHIQERFPELLEADGYNAGADALAMYSDEEYKVFEKDTEHMMYLRKKRFQRKAALNDWNYFVTITYDDEKMTAEDFPSTVKRALSTHSSRFDWSYCAVFEEGEKGGRIHLHALAYIPEGQEHGTFYARPQWSEKRHKYEVCNDHSYFHEKFGNCDFERIDGQNRSRMVRYLTKYMTKTDTKLIYSRGVPDEFHGVEVDEDDVLWMYRTQTGFIAVLADSAFGLIDDVDKETLKGFFDLGELGKFNERIIENPWKRAV